VITAVLQHQPYRPLSNLRRKPVRCLLRHGPILSIRGASDKPGAVHLGDWGRLFPSPAMTVAAIDRLVHHATIFEMNVES
jgi:hypothetical protein